MAWPGYFDIGGTEIINVARTQQYMLNDGVKWFKPAHREITGIPVHTLLGDHPYNSPEQDAQWGMPWFDPSDNDFADFYGFYPMSITGLEDSTRTSVVTENTGDGGNAGRIRNSTRTVVFTGLILAASAAGADFGMRWLRNTLLAGTDDGCSGAGCNGAQLGYFYAPPMFDEDDPHSDPASCLTSLLRYLNAVVVNNGPTVNSRNTTSTGGEVWNVTFTLVAGNPFEFGTEIPILDRWFLFPKDPHVINPGGGNYDSSGYHYDNVICPPKTVTPVFDPLYPDLILPPAPPALKLGGFNLPRRWERHRFNIPVQWVPSFTELVPIIRVHVGNREVRNMRVQLWANDGNRAIDQLPCQHIADYLITYAPPNGTLIIDGTTETVTFASPGQNQRADALVMKTNGMPLQWPRLSCGVEHLAALDFLITQHKPAFDFSVVPRNR